MEFSLKKEICLVALPFLYFTAISASYDSLSKSNMFTGGSFLPMAFLLVYIIYITLLKNYNCMSMSRFKNQGGLLIYFFIKSIPQTLFYLLYSVGIYLVSTLILKLNFQFMDIVRFLLFNFITLLIFNLYGIVFGIKCRPDFAKIPILILFVLLFALPSFSAMSQISFLKTLSFITYEAIPAFNALQIASIIFVYGLYILLALFVFFFWKTDIYGAKT